MAGRKRSQGGSMSKCKKLKQQTDFETVKDCNQWIPEDLILKILPRLPGKSLIRFKCVCKPWNFEISNLKFINTSQELILSSNKFMYAMDYEVSRGKVRKLDLPLKSRKSFRVLGSCNGLVWLLMNDESLIWNPFTGEQKKLPGSIFTIYLWQMTDMSSSSKLLGFGYDQSSDDYKIVWSQSLHSSAPIVSIFSLRKGSWKSLTFPECSRIYIQESQGTFVNSNVLYWRGIYSTLSMHTRGESCIICHNENCFGLHPIVLGIDLVDESHVVVCQHQTATFYYTTQLMDFKGSLCLIRNRHGKKIDMWVLNENNVKPDWMRLMSIEHPVMLSSFGFLEPIYFTSNGDVLMNIRKILYDYDDDSGRPYKRKKMFYVYNSTERSFRRIKVHGTSYWAKEITCNKSLASPTMATRQQEGI